MAIKVLSTALIRQLDERAVHDYSVPSIVLMENAGRGAAETLLRLGIGGPVVICCGPGNNGGDGLVVARHLDLRGVAVKVFVCIGPQRVSQAGIKEDAVPKAGALGLSADAATNYEIVRRSGIPLEVVCSADRLVAELPRASWIVDALLGTGSHGEPRPPLDAVIAAINAAGMPVLAIDLPSGLDAETGQPAKNTIRARHTCTFVAAKPGFLAAGAAEFTGELHVIDIGAPRKLVEEMLA